MVKVSTFRDLLVWQKSKQLSVEVYRAFESCRDYSFRDQIQRAVVSTMNNIAEGYARKSDKAFRNFLQISKGSAAEVESMLVLAKELGYINDKTETHLVVSATELQMMLTSFINKLSN